ncbi:MAG: 5-formyltetrahydrofolate cyclo-ligase [Balneolaceae bacterium]|nr:5-formyltetrahydrofolate cyclo-ligase [Balneolaceae bacterium]
MSEQVQKERVRTSLLDRRRRITKARYRAKSEIIRERLTDMPEFQDARTVHCYVSMNDRGEPDTHPLLREMLDAGRRVVVPVTDFDSGTLRHVELTSLEELRPNKWGVEEPEEGEEVPLPELDFIVVPMVGGDRQCNRLGYGKGFYDRFLERTDCFRVGLLFEECYVNELPADPFDVPMDAIVTDRQLVRRPAAPPRH